MAEPLYPTGAPPTRPRAAQPQDEAEMAWCHSCRRNHRMVRCSDCGTELSTHFLVHLCETCKATRRTTSKGTP
jgi:hypothetical protein